MPFDAAKPARAFRDPHSEFAASMAKLEASVAHERRPVTSGPAYSPEELEDIRAGLDESIRRHREGCF